MKMADCASAKKELTVLEQFSMNISEEVRKAIEEMGFEEPTPIQRDAIPPMLEGRDVIGQAQTGTGKTAAFGIPLVEMIDPSDRRVQAIVLSPTRELALQTAGELNKLSKYKRISTLPVYGGTPIERQLRELNRGVQIVIGTPGRVMDHMRRGSLDISGVKMAILDEADEMLDMGFREDIETILQDTPETRQTALFSATMPLPILSLGQKYLKDPVHIKVAAKEMTVDKVNQSYISVRSFQKGELLARQLVRDDTKLALVYCNTKLGVENVVTHLQSRGFSVAGLHGDMRQIERDAIMARFRAGMVSVLVATDVAARGIDVDGVETVFNYDIPLDVEYYVHRVGRTGRAGREGRAYTFVVGREVSRMWDYRKYTGAKILAEKAPTGEEISKVLAERMAGQIAEHAQQEVTEPNRELAQKLLETLDAETAVAALIGMVAAMGGSKIDASIDLNIPEPVRPPKPERKGRFGRPFQQERRGPYGRPVNPDANGMAQPARRGPYGRPVNPDANGMASPAPRGPYGRPVNPDANGMAAPVRPQRSGKPYARPADLDNLPQRGKRNDGEVRQAEPARKPRWSKAEKMNRKAGGGKPHRVTATE